MAHLSQKVKSQKDEFRITPFVPQQESTTVGRKGTAGGEMMKRSKVIVLTKNPLLRRLIEQELGRCECIEIEQDLRDKVSSADAMIMDTSLLSRTEREVLHAVAVLGGIRKAADVLCRSERTLKRELATIREKLGFRTTIELVVWAVYYRIVDPYAPQ